MKVRSILPALVIIGTLTANGQNPDASAQQHPAASAPATPAPVVAPGQPNAEQIKELNDALKMFQLDGLAVSTAQNTFVQTDPVAKKAMEILNDAMKNSEDIKKARAQQDTDQKAILAKIEVLRKAQTPPLDETWDWDFSASRFMKKTGAIPPPPPSPSTAPAKTGETKPKKG